MLRILHLADLHLGWHPAFLPQERRASRQRRRDGMLAAAVDFALQREHGIGMVVIAGDLFETHAPDGALVGAVVRELHRLVDAGIPVVTVPGNHDEITYHDSIYRRRSDDWPGVLVRHPLPSHVATLDVGGVPVYLYALAYTGGVTPVHRPLDAFPRLDAPGLHLAVFHGTLGDWAGERSLPLDAEALAHARYDYVALGHIHQHQARRLGATPAVYCGAVEGKDFADPGVGHWTVVEVDGAPGRFSVEVRLHPAPAQRHRTLEIDAGRFDDLAALQAEIGRLADPDLLLRVRLTGAPAFEVDPAELAAVLSSGFFHIRIDDDATALSPVLLDRWATEPTILGTFIRRMRARLDAARDDSERRLLQRALRQGVHALVGGSPR